MCVLAAWKQGGRKAIQYDLDVVRAYVSQRGVSELKIQLCGQPDLDTAAVWDELIASIDKEACQKLTIRTKMAALPEGWPASP